MAVTATRSVENTLAIGKLSDNTAQANRTWPAEGGKLRYAHFTYVAAAQNDITSTIELVKLPAGRVRVLPTRSAIKCSAYGGGATMDFGCRAYVASDGKTAVAENGTDFVATKDVSGALVDSAIGVSSMKKDYFSATGITVFATVRGLNMPIAATLEGWIAYEVIN